MVLQRSFPLFFAIPIAILIIVVSLCGLLIPGFYSRETLNWQAQSQGQDIADLFLAVPALLIAAWSAYKGSQRAMLVWAGVIIYLLYTFLIYCFGMHFNMLFPLYCIVLGLAFYALMYMVYTLRTSMISPEHPNTSLAKWTGMYMVFIGCMFYALWLMEIIPAILNKEVPASLTAVGLPTNPVHVIDLSVFLPGVIINGVLLLKGKMPGYFLAPLLLTFFVLMNITIGGLMLILKQRGMEANPGVAVMMGLLAVLSLVLLIFHLKQYKSALS